MHATHGQALCIRPRLSARGRQVGASEILHNDATQEPLLNLAPKKANWDLKRDVARKVARLEKRTQRAIIEMIREKVEGKALEGDDLNEAIENRQREAQMDSDDD